MGETLKTVQELIDESPVVDVTDMYGQWRDALEDLLKKVTDRFELKQDGSTKGLEVEGEIGSGIHGKVACFAGAEIDWLVYSWMADPKTRLREPAPDDLPRRADRPAGVRHGVRELRHPAVGVHRLPAAPRPRDRRATTTSSTSSRATSTG